jgi:hypothetical protein
MRMALGVAAAALAWGTAAWAAPQDFVLVNQTGYRVMEVYVSPTTVDDWEEDVLGKDTLPNNDRVTINFDRNEDRCRYDIKLVDEDGDEAIWTDINLCEVSTVTARYNRQGQPIADLD